MVVGNYHMEKDTMHCIVPLHVGLLFHCFCGRNGVGRAWGGAGGGPVV
jgi:hypothetical protein